MFRLLSVFFLIVVVLGIMLILLLRWASSRYIKTESAVFQHGGSEYSVSDTLSIITFNAAYFKGAFNPSRSVSEADMRSNLHSYAEIVEQLRPDIVALQEVDIDCRRTYHTNQVHWVASNLQFQFSAHALAWNKRYVPFPGSRFSEHFGSMASGQGLLSRYPITTNQRIVLPKADSLNGVNSSFLAQVAAGQLYTRRIAQVSSIRMGSQDLVVINVHLENSNATSRMRQMKNVIEQYQSIDPSLPVIILGDFNTIVPQMEQSISLTDRERSWFQNDQTLDMLGAESLNSLSFTSKDCSFPSTQPRLRFDHIFFNRWIEPIEEKVIYHSTASDHLPVWFRFKIRKP
jgi:endonuclease/exonuclease/phosphatase family metal-dependent hydrolase